MDENQQNQNEHVYSTVAKNPYLLPEPKKKSRIPWIVGIVVAVLVSFGLGIGFCLWVLRDAPAPAPVETAPGTQMADTAAHITDADMAETHGKPQDPPEDVTPEDATEPPVDPSVTGLPEGSIQTAPEPETPPTPDDPVDPETTACAHEYSDWQITTPATCTGAGLQTQSCQLCGEVRKEPIEPTGHTEEEVPAVEPTCTDHGYTAGIICTECGVMVVGQDIVPANGHTPGEWIVDRDPDWDIEGNKHTTCTVCGDLLTKEIRVSEGLVYVSNGDGTCTVKGIGTCTDTEIIIPATYNGERVTQLGDNSFNFCSKITMVYIPDSVTKIGAYAFLYCAGLTSVTFGDSLKEIGGSAFDGCSSLTNVVLPESVTHIGQNAFGGCTGLTSMNIPDSVSKVSSNSFAGCNNLIEKENGVHYVDTWVVGCDKEATEVAIREGTRGIALWAFRDCTSLTSVIIPEGVMYIHQEAFAGCTNLTSASIPKNVLYLDRSAFSDCSSLIQTENGISYVGNWIIDCADTNITSIIWRENTIGIGDYAFYECENLTSVTIPDSVTSIGNNAFQYCSSLTSINIPVGVPSIGNEAFYNCFKLTSIEIPDSVTSIGRAAFHGCSNLTSIVIPDSVTSIGIRAFSGCISLTEITVAVGNPVYHSDGNCIIETESKTLIAGCRSSVIPTDGSVTSIGDHAFWSQGLESIVIPDSVTSIGNYPFANCYYLSDIYYTGTESEWEAITKGTDWDDGPLSYTLHYNYTPN